MLLATNFARCEQMVMGDKAVPCLIKANDDVWNLPPIEGIETGPVYTVYGDTLLSESIDGRRLWYALEGDTAVFIKDETSLMEMTISPGAVAWIKKARTESEHMPFSAEGIYSQSFLMAESGTIRHSASKSGHLVFEPGDTIAVTMTREFRQFNAAIGHNATIPPIVKTDSADVFEIVITRWHSPLGRMTPVAVQIDSKTFDPSGKIVDMGSSAYTMSREQRDELRENADINSDAFFALCADALSKATVTTSPGKILVKLGNVECGFIILADVTDEGGILYLHKEGEARSNETIEIPTGDLGAGRYIVTLRAEGMAEGEKRLVMVR